MHVKRGSGRNAWHVVPRVIMRRERFPLRRVYGNLRFPLRFPLRRRVYGNLRFPLRFPSTFPVSIEYKKN